MQGLTPRVKEVRKLLVFLDVGQHNPSEVFAVEGKIVSEISKELLNDVFAEFDRRSRIKNITGVIFKKSSQILNKEDLFRYKFCHSFMRIHYRRIVENFIVCHPKIRGVYTKNVATKKHKFVASKEV